MTQVLNFVDGARTDPSAGEVVSARTDPSAGEVVSASVHSGQSDVDKRWSTRTSTTNSTSRPYR
ncbi:hypothetical protein [Amycolatopsis sp. NPDC051372]|uniref:hypothetical protein n=1 Tax=unclassified Amycolatopsis TaxID=2618356 RepID=UPI00343ACA87